jgi:hypothetical protein
MTVEEFESSINNLKEFMKELEKLNDVLTVISPTGTCVCEIGGKFIDDYISLVERSINDKDNSVSWFVFDNDFGSRKLTISLEGVGEYVISNEKILYEVLQRMNGIL